MNGKVTRRSVVKTMLAASVVGLAIPGKGSAADQPHMQAALDHLRAAKNELEKATTDKGGHRAKALTLTRDAIVQVEEGIKFDRRHP